MLTFLVLIFAEIYPHRWDKPTRWSKNASTCSTLQVGTRKLKGGIRSLFFYHYYGIAAAAILTVIYGGRVIIPLDCYVQTAQITVVVHLPHSSFFLFFFFFHRRMVIFWPYWPFDHFLCNYLTALIFQYHFVFHDSMLIIRENKTCPSLSLIDDLHISHNASGMEANIRVLVT